MALLMSFHTVLFVLPLALLCTISVSEPNYDGFSIDLIHRDSLHSYLSNSTVSYSNLINRSLHGFSIDLIHRDSLHSYLSNSTVSYINLINRSLHRSKKRADNLAAGTPTTDLIASGGEFLMKLSVGTPPIEVNGILDTTSALSWMQCAPCEHCFAQKLPLFTPKKSSTYKVVPGNSKLCKSYGGKPSTSGENSCRYSLFYLLRYHSRGVIFSDILTMKTTSGTPTSLPNLVFGCGFDNYAGFKEASGVIGMGVGPTSLITQMNPVIGGKFSYCLVHNPNINPKSSKMYFGSKAAVTGAAVVSSALQFYKNSYALILKGISVGNTRLMATARSATTLSNISSSSSSKIFGLFNERIIVDSGSIITYLPKNLYASLEAAVKKQMNLETVYDPGRTLSLCYKTTDEGIRGPIVTLHFAGANVKLYAINTFLKVAKNIHCLAFVPQKGVAILGNLAQVNFLVGFDLKKKVVSFKRTDCSS